jgi:peptidyl-prolyl cis-trans isomerase A (cyclophilin A)
MSCSSRIAVVVCACFFLSISAGAQTPAPAPEKKPAGEEKTPAAKAASFDPALLQPETLRAKAPTEFQVKFETTAGDFTVKVTRAWSPNGADRIYNLVQHHFYDGAAFFRVLSGFMAQFGLSAYPEVNQVWEHANIKDDPLVQSNHRGFVTFATAGPNTRTTQIFINFGDNASLDHQGFTPFGVVTDGMDVVDKLYSSYGEGAPEGHGPNQTLVGARGRAYLEKYFPKLDTIRTATIVPSGAAPTSGKSL